MRSGLDRTLTLALLGWPVLWQIVGFQLRSDRIDGPAYWLTDAAIYTGIPLAITAFAIARRWVTTAELGFVATIQGRRNPLHLAIMLAGAPPFGILTYLAARRLSHELSLVGLWESPFDHDGYTYMVSVIREPSIRFLAVLYLSASAGVVEELCFRAMLFRLVSPHWRDSWRYVALSASLFGLFHWWQGPGGMLTTALFGGTHALLYRAARNIWPVIASHAATDLLWHLSAPRQAG